MAAAAQLLRGHVRDDGDDETAESLAHVAFNPAWNFSSTGGDTLNTIISYKAPDCNNDNTTAHSTSNLASRHRQ